MQIIRTNTGSGSLIKLFSDHQPYFILHQNIKYRDHKLKYIKICKQDIEYVQSFQQKIIHSLEHVNLSREHMPDKLVKLNKNKHRANLYKKYKMTSHNSPEFDIQKYLLKSI